MHTGENLLIGIEAKLVKCGQFLGAGFLKTINIRVKSMHLMFEGTVLIYHARQISPNAHI